MTETSCTRYLSDIHTTWVEGLAVVRVNAAQGKGQGPAEFVQDGLDGGLALAEHGGVSQLLAFVDVTEIEADLSARLGARSSRGTSALRGGSSRS